VLLYFDKSVHELTGPKPLTCGAAKGPNNYIRSRREDAIGRRNYVLDRMAEDGYSSPRMPMKAKKEPFNVTVRDRRAHLRG